MAARLHLIRRQLRRERVLCDRNSPLEEYDDEGLRSRFRLSRSLLLDICVLVQAKIQRGTARCGALPMQLIVCVALRFLATGSIHSRLGNGQGLSIPTILDGVCGQESVAKYSFPTKLPSNYVKPCSHGRVHTESGKSQVAERMHMQRLGHVI
jgi:hypothetical protein